MLNFSKLRRWPTRLFKRRYPRPTQPACSLASCARLQSLWQRLRDRHRPRGTYLQGAFYCRPQCLESALVGQLSQLRIMAPASLPPNRIPLGLLMVARGKITYLEVSAALEAQRRASYGKIGEWIEKLGFATEQDVTTALALQWGCPVASSLDLAALQPFGNIPLPILETFQMLPFNYVASTNTLYLAFGERVDHAALYAVEKILDCRTQPCVAGRQSIARQLDAMGQMPRLHDVEFGPMNDLAEMARIASSYTARLTPEQVRLSRIGRFIWLRLDVNRYMRSKTRPLATNLIFRLATAVPTPMPFVRPSEFHTSRQSDSQ
jgi:Type II secretion system (T2SS), protein E, N-terminal domain